MEEYIIYTPRKLCHLVGQNVATAGGLKYIYPMES